MPNGQGISINGALGTGGQLIGTTTNDNATAGNIGEYISAFVAVGSPTALTSTANLNMATITLTPGDWDVTLLVNFIAGAATSVTYEGISISATSVTLDQTSGRFASVPSGAGIVQGSLVAQSISVPVYRINVAASTTLQLWAVVQAGFTVSTLSVSGILSARRTR